ncbi:hypothetical protein HPB50_022358 [Hyalomma asiaticum]|uniref:Uncharacterized protein n=1 Tax=Hyalomma asiaticum TaxID=266040 RepID=A0ACB7S1Z8_HYAAI|nr:hypothetical protein HPB50_022358 [Hyalomma asiaticum]
MARRGRDGNFIVDSGLWGEEADTNSPAAWRAPRSLLLAAASKHTLRCQQATQQICACAVGAGGRALHLKKFVPVRDFVSCFVGNGGRLLRARSLAASQRRSLAAAAACLLCRGECWLSTLRAAGSLGDASLSPRHTNVARKGEGSPCIGDDYYDGGGSSGARWLRRGRPSLCACRGKIEERHWRWCTRAHKGKWDGNGRGGWRR